MRLSIILLLCVFALTATAAKKAVTEDGDVVILNNDGTWLYEDTSVDKSAEIPVNTAIFNKPSDVNFELKSSKTNAAFGINTKKWKFTKNENNHDSAEYIFELKGGDLYGMAISEQIEIDVEELANIAFDNALGAAPDTKIVKKEYREVNGNRLIYMEMVGTIQSIKFKYLGYYYSNSTGSTQFLAYTSQNLVDKYRSDIDDFLNGFALQQ